MGEGRVWGISRDCSTTAVSLRPEGLCSVLRPVTPTRVTEHKPYNPTFDSIMLEWYIRESRLDPGS
jgi:hypothetical protein